MHRSKREQLQALQTVKQGEHLKKVKKKEKAMHINLLNGRYD